MSTCTPTTSISRSRRLDRDRDAAGQPAAADRDDDLRQVGHVVEQLEAERPLAGDDVGVVERVHEGHAGLLRARPAPPPRTPPRRRRPRCTIAPSAPHPSIFEIGASTGMNTSHGTPRALAAWASAQAWLPALPPVTPRAHPSPRAASLFSAPRILNEPVRCRFSALSATTPSRRWVSVSDGSTGVRLATSAIAPRARSMSSGVTVARVGDVAIGRALGRQRDDGVDLDLRAQRQRGHADRAAGRRLVAEEARRRPR